MRTFLGVFLVLIVAGEATMEMKTITAHLEDDVLLPCSCPERSLHREVKWQMEEPIKRLLLKYNGTSITSVERKGNVRIFLPEKSENCSVLLINVSVSDQGQYRCIFHSKTYQKVFVNLNLSARYKVCQNDSAKNLSDAKVFQCDAVGSYPEAEIQWNLGGQPLDGSLNVNITHKKWQRAPGIYQFSSTLIIKLNNETTQPTCDVKSEHVSNNIEEGCDGVLSPFQGGETPPDVRHHYVKIIPIMLLSGVLLVLWRSLRSRGVTQR